MRISDKSRMQLSSQDTRRAICCAGLKMKRHGPKPGEESGGDPDHALFPMYSRSVGRCGDGCWTCTFDTCVPRQAQVETAPRAKWGLLWNPRCCLQTAFHEFLQLDIFPGWQPSPPFPLRATKTQSASLRNAAGICSTAKLVVTNATP